MVKQFRIIDRRLRAVEEPPFQVMVCSRPTEDEIRYLVDTLKIDEHTLHSALDPEELARLEFEPEHIAVIYKHPATYIADDEFLFKVNSVGAFIFKDFLLVVFSEDLPIPDGMVSYPDATPMTLFIRMLGRTITHFREHLKVIDRITDELEERISASLSNLHLVHLFSIQKSLIYYVEALTTNDGLLERIRRYSNRIGLTEAEEELLEDTIIDNHQCLKQAEISATVLSNLMDARVSIINNNLNILMKTLNIITIGIMVPTFVVSAFSMNVALPLQHLPYAYWLIMG
ncbi:MAG: magnesium transporter CorA family protein, partial [bacterium]